VGGIPFWFFWFWLMKTQYPTIAEGSRPSNLLFWQVGWLMDA
jgi:hypothetical protein